MHLPRDLAEVERKLDYLIREGQDQSLAFHPRPGVLPFAPRPVGPSCSRHGGDTDMTPPYCMRTHLRRSTRRATVCRLAAFVLVGLLGASGLSRGQTVEVITSLVRAPNGRQPRAGLIQSNDGNFYGTTSGGGASSLGTLFKVDASGTLTTLHSFTGSDGAYPSAGLIQASDGSFYGTTSDGGASWNGDLFPEGGTVFKLDAAGTLTTLHSFTGIDGRWPLVGLIQARDGSFYGTTSSGGTSERCGDFGCGTVFKIDAAGTLTTLHSFTGTYPGDDGGPSVLIQASDGSF